MTRVFTVTLYPYEDSGDPAIWYFDDRWEAEAFASHVTNDLAPELVTYLAGGEGPVLVREVTTVSLAVAKAELENLAADEGS